MHSSLFPATYLDAPRQYCGCAALPGALHDRREVLACGPGGGTMTSVKVNCQACEMALGADAYACPRCGTVRPPVTGAAAYQQPAQAGEPSRLAAGQGVQAASRDNRAARPAWWLHHPLRRLAFWLTIMLTGFALVTLGGTAANFAAVPGSVDPAPKGAGAALFVVGVLLLLNIIPVFLIWLYHASRNAEQLGHWPRRSAGWAIGGWFIPVVSLWFPCQAVSDLWRAAQPPERRTRIPWLVVAWWTCWLLAWLTSFAVIHTDQGIFFNYGLYTTDISRLVLAIGGLLLIMIVRKVSKSPLGDPQDPGLAAAPSHPAAAPAGPSPTAPAGPWPTAPGYPAAAPGSWPAAPGYPAAAPAGSWPAAPGYPAAAPAGSWPAAPGYPAAAPAGSWPAAPGYPAATPGPASVTSPATSDSGPALAGPASGLAQAPPSQPPPAGHATMPPPAGHATMPPAATMPPVTTTTMPPVTTMTTPPTTITPSTMTSPLPTITPITPLASPPSSAQRSWLHLRTRRAKVLAGLSAGIAAAAMIASASIALTALTSTPAKPGSARTLAPSPSASTPSPATPTPTPPMSRDDRWLNGLSSLQTMMTNAMGTRPSVITPESLLSTVRKFRRCTAELAGLGQPSRQLLPVYRQARQACIDYAQAANSFTAAAGAFTEAGPGSSAYAKFAKLLDRGTASANQASAIIANAVADGTVFQTP